MPNTETGYHEALCHTSTVRQLTSADDFVAWSVWQHEQNGECLSGTRQQHLLEMYESMIKDGIQPFDGSSIENPAVFALFDGLRIAASGTIYRSDFHFSDRFLPVGHEYGYMDAAKTDPGHLNKGYNTRVTHARIAWAKERGLSWVYTNVSSRNLSSLKAKLKAGFILNTSYYGLGLLYPISEEVVQSLGLQPEVAFTSCNTINYDPDTNLALYLPEHYAVLDPNALATCGQVGLRILSRVFPTPKAN